MEYVDKKLVKKAKTGDINAFSELIHLYKDKIFNLAYRLLGNVQEAEDISQETFLRVYTNLDKYDENYKFSPLIFRIATNLCIDRIRKKRADFSLDQSWDTEDGIDYHSIIPSYEKSPEDEVISMEQHNQIQQAILGLPPKYRIIMTLRYIQDLSIQEISNIVNLSLATVKTRLHRGREYLRKQLVAGKNAGERSGLYEMS